MSLPELELNYTHFLDRSTLLYGESGTGKSFIMVDILYQLKPYVDQIIVISPTDRQNHTYDKGIVPLPCIHYTISPTLLTDIWERQSALAAVYTKANNPEVLRALFDKCRDRSRADATIAKAHKRLREYTAELGDDSTSKAKITQMDTECRKLITMI